MFRITDSQTFPSNHQISRRDFLHIGSLALGGLTLPHLLSMQSQAAETRRLVHDKSVVLLFLQGGPSQIETFDPKMSAPQEIRSISGEIQTKLPGVTFGSHFSRLADLADKLAVVRSFQSNNGDHQNYVATAGGNAIKVPMGSIYARIAGPNSPQTGMPNNVLVPPESVGQDVRLGQNFETESLNKLTNASRMLGASYGFFDPSGGGELRRNLELRLPRTRFEDRRNLLNQLDGFRRQVETTGALDQATAYEQQAFDIIARGIAQAFDLNREDPRVMNRYDTSNHFSLETVNRWGDMRRSSNLLGKQMLLARRLCEAGCGFVTVVDAGWDMHSNGNSPANLGGMWWLAPQVDHAVSAFLEDIEARGLSEKILLVVTGEMGRTPRISNRGGRDHWGNLTPLLIAGGGLRMGQVIGQSDRQAGNPASAPYNPGNLYSTVMNTLLDVGQVRVSRDIPKNVVDSLSGGSPIRELF